MDNLAKRIALQNEITRLPEELREKGLSSGYQILKEGGSIYDFYMVKWGGVNPANGVRNLRKKCDYG